MCPNKRIYSKKEDDNVVDDDDDDVGGDVMAVSELCVERTRDRAR